MTTIVKLLVKVALIGILLLCTSCAFKKESSSEVAQSENEKKFDTQDDAEDARFLVNAVSDSYAILELAGLAQRKGNGETARKAGEIIEGQANVLNDLKEYAAGEVISIPESDPEEIKNDLKDLYDENNRFNEKWCREVINRNERMLKEFEEYMEKTDSNLKIVIAESLPILRSHQDKLQAYKTAMND